MPAQQGFGIHESILQTDTDKNNKTIDRHWQHTLQDRFRAQGSEKSELFNCLSILGEMRQRATSWPQLPEILLSRIRSTVVRLNADSSKLSQSLVFLLHVLGYDTLDGHHIVFHFDHFKLSNFVNWSKCKHFRVQPGSPWFTLCS